MGNAYPFIVGLKWLVGCCVREKERGLGLKSYKSWTELKPTLAVGRGSCTLKARQEVLIERAK